ncbi:Transposase insN for insertion sequence element IS911A [Salmonella enterica]|uniref:Transposase insN for insertion sequence element IS911A n=1 Tax=Salmonella enterica TaxID=28901 RepID=A0A379QQY1_SALER|nr:Transposase insN for insertion sequence element IS911A [Salmonella enterica]
MGTPRFTPEFKEEAVRQITERGYSIAEVSERLGVSAHSLYKCLRLSQGSWRSSRNWRSVQQKPGCQNHEEKQDPGYTWL